MVLYRLEEPENWEEHGVLGGSGRYYSRRTFHKAGLVVHSGGSRVANVTSLAGSDGG